MKKLFYYQTYHELLPKFIERHNFKKQDIQSIVGDNTSYNVHIFYWAKEKFNEDYYQ